MQDILIRIETDDFAAWAKQHYSPRRQPGDLRDRGRAGLSGHRQPQRGLVPHQDQDVDRAMGWFQSDTFRAATKLAKVTSRSFYDAQPRSRG